MNYKNIKYHIKIVPHGDAMRYVIEVPGWKGVMGDIIDFGSGVDVYECIANAKANIEFFLDCLLADIAESEPPKPGEAG